MSYDSSLTVNINQQNNNHHSTLLAGCEECDAVYKKVALASGERAYCSCCGAELYRENQSFSTLLALVITAFIVFIIANSFSIVQVELQGVYTETTLLGAVKAMFDADRAFVGILILVTTFIVPLMYLLLMAYVLSAVTVLKSMHQSILIALRTLYVLRIWGMVEVFLIGVLVTLVKLVAMVVVIPGIALWAFAILSLLLVYIASIKIKDLWDAIDRYLAL